MTPFFIIDVVLAVAGGCILLWRWHRAITGKRADSPEREGGGGGTPRWSWEVIPGAVVAYLTAYALLHGFFSASSRFELEPATAQLLSGMGAQVLGGAVCFWVGATRWEGGGRGFLLGCERSADGFGLPRALGFTAGTMIAALGVCPAVLWITIRVFSPFFPGLGTEVHPTLALLRDPGTPPWLLAGLWLAAVVVAPVSEELFFRGIVQNTLRGMYGSRHAAVALSSGAFALVHGGQPAALPALVLLSMLLGYLYERHGGLLFPLIVHAVFNARTMLWETAALR